MNVKARSPFFVADEILDHNDYDLAILDFHAETTSEKMVLANYLKQKVGIFYGTHTHVQTSDERLIGDMAYITDVGMTGVLNSAIGADFYAVTEKMMNDTVLPFREAEGGELIFNSILVEINEETKKPISIERKVFKYK